GLDGELATGVELRHAGAGPGAAGRAVEPAGVDGHRVAGVPRVRAGRGEVDVVDPANVLALGVDGLVGGVQRLHDRQTGGEQPVLLTAVEGQGEVFELDEGVEVPAEAEVVRDGAETGHLHVRVASHQEGGHVRERHRFGAAVADGDLDDDEAGRGVQADRGDRLGHLHHPGLHQHCRGADGAVAAHGQQPGDLDVEHTPV